MKPLESIGILTPRDNVYRTLSHLKISVFSEKVIGTYHIEYEVLAFLNTHTNMRESSVWPVIRVITNTLESINEAS